MTRKRLRTNSTIISAMTTSAVSSRRDGQWFHDSDSFSINRGNHDDVAIVIPRRDAAFPPSSSTTMTTTTSRILQSPDGGGQERRGYGFFLLVCVVLAALYVIYLAYRRWRNVRLFQQVEQTNAQADQVLEEMQLDRAFSHDDDDEEEGYTDDVEISAKITRDATTAPNGGSSGNNNGGGRGGGLDMKRSLDENEII